MNEKKSYLEKHFINRKYPSYPRLTLKSFFLNEHSFWYCNIVIDSFTSYSSLPWKSIISSLTPPFDSEYIVLTPPPQSLLISYMIVYLFQNLPRVRHHLNFQLYLKHQLQPLLQLQHLYYVVCIHINWEKHFIENNSNMILYLIFICTCSEHTSIGYWLRLGWLLVISDNFVKGSNDGAKVGNEPDSNFEDTKGYQKVDLNFLVIIAKTEKFLTILLTFW